MSQVRAVLFDLDDTLCDSSPAFQAGLNAALELIRYRYPFHSLEEMNAAWVEVHRGLLAGLTSGEFSMAEVRELRFARLFEALEIDEPSMIVEANHLLGTTQLKSLALFDDVYVLEELRGMGIYVGVVTNGAGDGHPDSQRSKAQRLGLLKRVDSFWVSDEMRFRKPDSRAFVPALEAAGCLAGQALFVGDSVENDVVGANSAGMVSVLLDRSGVGGGDKAKVVVGSLVEVLDLV